MTSGFRVVFTGPNQVILKPTEFGAPEQGHVLLRSDRTLISAGTELNVLTGQFLTQATRLFDVGYPSGTGYCNAATVIEVGEGVDNVEVGNRVASHAAHATHAIFPAAKLWMLPENVDSEAGAFAVVGEIVMGGLRRGRLAFGESVVIVGAGLLGQLAAHFCRAAGAWPIIMVDTASSRLERATGMGATHTLALDSDAAAEPVHSLTKGRGADLVIEVTGNANAIPGALKLARPLGRVVLLGSPRGITTVDLYGEAHLRSLEIIGAHNSAHPPAGNPHTPWTVDRHVELFLEWQSAGIIDVHPLITHRYPWRQAPEAYQFLIEDRTRTLGVVLDWSG